MLEHLDTLSQMLTALGLTAAALSATKRFWERRRWLNFRQRVSEWTDSMVAIGIRLDEGLTDKEWQAECEIMLTDVGFTPLEIPTLLDLAVVVAKGISSSKFLA